MEDDTIQLRRCGCVPQLSLVYEDLERIRNNESLENNAEADRGGWARRFPLLGPFWCVKSNGTTVRRRDNAVYRSNSFKFERRSTGPEAEQGVGHMLQQDIESNEVGDRLQVLPHHLKSNHPSRVMKPPELMLNINYSDPQDAESESSWGNVNKAYDAGDESGVEDVHQSNIDNNIANGNGRGYKLKFGQDIYYCKPYQPFHTQLKYNFSDLLESGVDSEYEEMAGARAAANNNNPGQCPTCVTVINVCPSPGHTLSAIPKLPQIPENYHKLKQKGHLNNEPQYENLAFHKVTINVPDTCEDSQQEKSRNLLRQPPLRKSKVPLRYQGIKRIKSKSKTQQKENGKGNDTDIKGDKGGYSQSEVWNWLYLDASAKYDANNQLGKPGDYSDSSGKSVSVQFSPAEFLQATNRLAHLSLEGFERFVGNTIDRALAGARAKSSDMLNSSFENSSSQVSTQETKNDRQENDSDIYVSKEPKQIQTSCDQNSKIKPTRPVCESCLKSGESSCSSALSSLESVKSSGGSTGVCSRHRGESDSSARGSSFSSSETGIQRCATPLPPVIRNQSEDANNQPDYIRMSGQKIYRGKVRASLPVGGQNSQLASSVAGASSYSLHAHQHKPYQTLELNLTQEPVSRCQSHSQPPMFRGKHMQLHLVDPSIHLHQQEWYHGNVSRLEAETALRLHPPGSYLVRNCESARKDYSLSLKSSAGFMHMRIQATPSGHYILGQFSRPFASIADMINYYTINRLPIKGAEHVSLRQPVCEQLL